MVRRQKVMTDRDLAELHQVTTGNLNLAVHRNKARFPQDFMFRLSASEAKSLQWHSARPKAAGGEARCPTRSSSKESGCFRAFFAASGPCW